MRTTCRSPRRLTQQGQETRDRIDHSHDIDREHPGPVLVGEFIDSAELLHTHIGAQHVTPVEATFNKCGGSGQRCLVRHIDGDGDDVHAPLAQLSRFGLGAHAVDIEQRKSRARRGKNIRHGRPKTGTCTGYHYGLTLIFHTILSPLCLARAR